MEWFYPTHQEDPNIYNDLTFESYFTEIFEKRASSIKGVVLQIPPFPTCSMFIGETIKNCCALLRRYQLPVYLQGLSNLAPLYRDMSVAAFFSLRQIFPDLQIRSVDSELISNLIASGHALIKSTDGHQELPVSVINVNDVIYVSDGTPIQKDCPCYACVHHTKAYIHHLLHTKEMLAQVLLSLYISFFIFPSHNFYLCQQSLLK